MFPRQPRSSRSRYDSVNAQPSCGHFDDVPDATAEQSRTERSNERDQMVRILSILGKDYGVDSLLLKIQVCNHDRRIDGHYILRHGARQDHSGIAQRLVDQFDVRPALQEMFRRSHDGYQSGQVSFREQKLPSW